MVGLYLSFWNQIQKNKIDRKKKSKLCSYKFKINFQKFFELHRHLSHNIWTDTVGGRLDGAREHWAQLGGLPGGVAGGPGRPA